MLSSNMLLLILILLIDVTFSTATGFNTNYEPGSEEPSSSAPGMPQLFPGAE